LGVGKQGQLGRQEYVFLSLGKRFCSSASIRSEIQFVLPYGAYMMMHTQQDVLHLIEGRISQTITKAERIPW
jgi:hypothetical protein